MARNKFDVDEDLASEFNFGHLKRVYKYVIPYKKEMILTLILMLTSSFVSLLGPILLKQAMDDKIPNKDIPGLALIALGYIATLVICALCMKFRMKKMAYVGQNVIMKIRSDLFTHLQKLPFTYYDSRPHGKILVRVVNYVNTLSDLLSSGVINIINDFFSLVVIIGFMLFLNVKLTLVCLGGLPLLAIVILLLKNSQRKAYRKVSSKLSNLNAYIHESICGIRVTQSFAREDVNLGIFEDVGSSYKSSWMKAISIQNLLWPGIDMISVLTTSAIYVVGIMSIGDAISVGTLVAFTGYISRFWAPIMNLGNYFNSIVNSMAYLERIFETIDEEPTVKDIENAKTMPKIQGNVEFKDVVFGYEDGADILKHVSFDIKEGQNIALVGPTGAGKSTIVNLISRFYDVKSGQVLVDGVDIRDVTLNSLRSQMGVMLQDTFIFSGTIMDNIRYGKLDATDEEVMEAAKTVRAHEFIMSLEKGYRTEVNERGSRLSTGQRQLISFARALLASPKILILDEATSSIDTKTEIMLQKGLEELLKGRTSFVIAHRLSTIRNATRIMYIDRGQIVEQGTHEELMALKGEYYKQCMTQYEYMKAI